MRPSLHSYIPLSLFSVLFPRLQCRVLGCGCSSRARWPRHPPLHSYSPRIDLHVHVHCNCGLRWPGPRPPPVSAPRTAQARHSPGFLLLPPAVLYCTVYMCTVVYSDVKCRDPELRRRYTQPSPPQLPNTDHTLAHFEKQMKRRKEYYFLPLKRDEMHRNY